jgi:hypothetical protein
MKTLKGKVALITADVASAEPSQNATPARCRRRHQLRIGGQEFTLLAHDQLGPVGNR